MATVCGSIFGYSPVTRSYDNCLIIKAVLVNAIVYR